jgi:hypothetical protein
MVDDVDVLAMSEAGYKTNALRIDLHPATNVWYYYYCSSETTIPLERSFNEDEELTQEYRNQATKKTIVHQYPIDKLNPSQEKFARHLMFLMLSQLDMKLDNSEFYSKEVVNNAIQGINMMGNGDDRSTLRRNGFHLLMTSCDGKISMLDFCSAFFHTLENGEYFIQHIRYNHTKLRGFQFIIVQNPDYNARKRKSKKQSSRSRGNNNNDSNDGAEEEDSERDTKEESDTESSQTRKKKKKDVVLDE